jgi:mRNA-degrading endonuclease RelE of RelBE toxin-antitoxin system
MFRLEFRETARRQLIRIARRNSDVGHDLKVRIQWLVANIEEVDHEKMHGHDEYSLYSGQYRILYSMDRSKQLVIIEDIDKHDTAYRKLRRR